MHRQPELAATLEKIADNGRDAFYAGEVMEDILAYLQGRGGLHTEADFSTVKGDYVEPISTDFRGYRVHECPPNGQGVIALLLLNMMSGIETGHASDRAGAHPSEKSRPAASPIGEESPCRRSRLLRSSRSTGLLSESLCEACLRENIDPERANEKPAAGHAGP